MPKEFIFSAQNIFNLYLDDGLCRKNRETHFVCIMDTKHADSYGTSLEVFLASDQQSLPIMHFTVTVKAFYGFPSGLTKFGSNITTYMASPE